MVAARRLSAIVNLLPAGMPLPIVLQGQIALMLRLSHQLFGLNI